MDTKILIEIKKEGHRNTHIYINNIMTKTINRATLQDIQEYLKEINAVVIDYVQVEEGVDNYRVETDWINFMNSYRKEGVV